jgi:hypothetical protein
MHSTYVSRHEEPQGTSLGKEALGVDGVDYSINLIMGQLAEQ